MTSTGRPTLDELTGALNSAYPALTGEERSLAVAIYRSLVTGRPVTMSDLSRSTGRTQRWIRELLDNWSGVFRDGEGRVIAFWGLALPEMPHRLDVNGTQLFTWCAWDPLFIAPLLEVTGRVSSECPVTKATITLTVDADGVRDVEPPCAVLSFVSPSEKWSDDVIETFCHYIHLFASREAAEQWVTENPGTFVLEIEEAFVLATRTLGRLAGAKEAL